ncbi:lyase family protein [Streptomyces sp. 5-6(2022)]|uniref:lyase family protein n=1 Tax=Streptomyces sp. 5-6(2022) TaxID=2936510 RepID=UPI0023B9EC60|nr:lyase family protein [Streptomyces sp. 5-6(2022)]
MLQQPPERYRGYRTAGIRMNEDLLEELSSHRTEKFGVTLEAVHAFDKAHIVMLIEQGLVNRSDGRQILEAIRRMERQGVWETRLHAQGGEHSCEQYLIQNLGEHIGGQINLGRSSGDLGEVSRRLTMRKKIIDALAALNGLRECLIGLSERHIDVVFPAQTFLQHAQPTSFGHWFGMWATALARDTDRLLGLIARVNQSPAGAGILTGSEFPISRHRTADLLGFDAPMSNTFDAIISHDVNLEAISVTGGVWCDFARLSDDVELWLSSDVQYVDVPDRFCDTSSVMPQKRNPSLPQQIKAQAVKATGAITSGFMAERGASGQPMMERFEAERLLWELLDDLVPLSKDLGLMLEALIPQSGRMLQAALDGWSTASDLAGLMVTSAGLSWRSAHQITGIVVRLSGERAISPAQVTSELIDEAAELYFGKPLALTPEAIADTIDPARSVQRRSVYGGPARAMQEGALAELRRGLKQDGAVLHRYQERISEAARQLEGAIDAILI